MKTPLERLEEFETKYGTYNEMLSRLNPCYCIISNEQVELRESLKEHHVLIRECMVYNQEQRDSKKNKEEMTIAYMCGVDWDYELGESSDGTKVYPDIECLKADRGCNEKCGVVEVEVKLKRIVEPGGIQRTGE